MTNIGIVLAAGSGTRTKLQTPKQYVRWNYLFSLDDDLEFEKEWWSKISQGIQENFNKTTHFTCTVLNGPKEEIFCYGQNLIFDSAGGVKRDYIKKVDSSKYLECEVACGAMKILARATAELIDFEDVFLGEDILFDLDLLKLGVNKCIVVIDAVVFHKRDPKSAPPIVNFRIKENYEEAALRLWQKHKKFVSNLKYREMGQRNIRDIRDTRDTRGTRDMRSMRDMRDMRNVEDSHIKSEDSHIKSEDAIAIIVKFKNAMEKLNIDFWITAGTLLGSFRKGKIISHDRDMDFGIFAHDWSSAIIGELEKVGFKHKYQFGREDIGLEYAFTYKNLKFDVFFFYKSDDKYWHAVWDKVNSTNPFDRKMLKYNYTPFELEYRNFMGELLLHPKNTELFLLEQYGPNWKEPQKDWKWNSSPFNLEQTDIIIPFKEFK